MPELRNTRHETFCSLVVQGLSNLKAYEQAGYKARSSSAADLRALPKISERINELLAARDAKRQREMDKAADKAGVSRADVMEMLVEDRRDARERGQYGPAVRAAELLGKELGMFIDRREIKEVDEFDKLSDEELKRLAEQRAAELERKDKTEH